MALLGHELCAPVDIDARLTDAELHARRGTERERSHVHSVIRHIDGDSRPLVAHLARFPADALLLSVAVPTIAFAGVTTTPQDAWEIVERCAPAYGDDWWFTGLLAFIRQEQGRFDEAMELSCRSLDTEPGAGHSAHARTHAHYETGDHAGGLAWMDGWITGAGARTSIASATSPGTPPCTSCPWATWTGCAAATTPSCGRAGRWAAAAWSTAARCCGGGR